MFHAGGTPGALSSPADSPSVGLEWALKSSARLPEANTRRTDIYGKTLNLFGLAI
jgi:hypothetical protein